MPSGVNPYSVHDHGEATRQRHDPLVSLTETSSPAKWSMLRFSF
jgi:hypothetical protein